MTKVSYGIPGKQGKSEAEDEMARVIQYAELPEPERQWHYAWCCEHSKKDHKPAEQVPGAALGLPAACVGCMNERRASTRLSFAHEFRRDSGFRADFAWPDHRLLLEVQGGIYTRRAHGSVKGVLADIDRLNEATLHGWRLLRVTPHHVQDGTALELLEHALAVRQEPGSCAKPACPASGGAKRMVIKGR